MGSLLRIGAVRTVIRLLCPGEDSNLDDKSARNQSLGVMGFFEFPKTLPMPMARWGGTAWHPAGWPEHAP